MDELLVSGYCRCLDGARTVLAEPDGDGIEADCSYADCPHRQSCQIAQQLDAFCARLRAAANGI